jgi:hypothetical protein
MGIILAGASFIALGFPGGGLAIGFFILFWGHVFLFPDCNLLNFASDCIEGFRFTRWTVPELILVVVGAFALESSLNKEEPEPLQATNKQEGKSESTTKQGSKKSRDPSYKGSYKSGKFHGTGTYTYPDGTTYKGEWKDGKYHGNGTQRSPNGRTLSGQWKDGKFLGKPAVKKVAKKSASSPTTAQRLSSDSVASKATKPIREINRYGTGNPSTSSSQASSSIREDLQELKSLLDDGLINEKDYEKKKNDLLSKM